MKKQRNNGADRKTRIEQDRIENRPDTKGIEVLGYES